MARPWSEGAGRPLRLFVSAGEASGDRILGAVLARLRERLGGESGLLLCGLGGEAAEKQGLRSLAPMSRLAVNGAADVLRQAPFFWLLYRRLLKAFEAFAPDRVLLVDYPGLHERLMRHAKRRGVPVVYVSPPQLWAYKDPWKRAHPFKGVTVQTLFPFEGEIYRKAGAAVHQGHFFGPVASGGTAKGPVETGGPSAGGPASGPGQAGPEAAPARESLLLAPGSRSGTLRRNLPLFLQATRLFAESARHSGDPVTFLLLTPPHLRREAEIALSRSAPAVAVEFTSDKEAALSRSRAALATPGTFTLELALAGVPFLALARLDRLTFALGKRKLAVPFLSWPNILLGREVFPEWAGVREPGEESLRHLVQRLIAIAPLTSAEMERLFSALGEGCGAEKTLSLLF